MFEEYLRSRLQSGGCPQKQERRTDANPQLSLICFEDDCKAAIREPFAIWRDQYPRTHGVRSQKVSHRIEAADNGAS